MKKVMSLLAVAVMLIGVLSGCAGETADENAFKIGGTGPLTGGAAIYGNAAKRGAEIAIEEINAMGGIQFALKYEDDQHDPEKAVNAYNAVKDWGMVLSLGSVTSKPAEATSTLSMKDRIFALTPSASSTGTVEGKDNVYQMCFMDPNQGYASARYISEKKLATKVAVIYMNDDPYSSGIYETFKDEAGKVGLEIVSATTFANGNDTDFSVQVKEAKDKGAELVFLPMYYQPASLIFIEAKKQNFTPKWFGVDGMDGILTLKGFDKSMAEGVMLLTPFNADATDDKTKAFVAKYQEKYGEVPNQFAADAYDCIHAIVEAIDKADIDITADGADIAGDLAKAMRKIKIEGLTGELTWNDKGQVEKPATAYVIQDGKYIAA